MFDPADIVDPSEKFLSAKESRTASNAAIATSRYDRHRIGPLLWLVGSAVYAMSTLVLVLGLGPWEGRSLFQPHPAGQPPLRRCKKFLKREALKRFQANHPWRYRLKNRTQVRALR
jgi:hypothetical protein